MRSAHRGGLAAFACLVAVWPSHAVAEAPRDAKTSAATPASATLHVTPGALGTPWTFEVTNSDTTPLRVVADGRLLTLDVTPGDGDDGDDKAAHPKKHATVHCALPADVRPTTDTDGATLLEPEATYVEEFDPRLYCFSAHDAAALVPGARVVAHLGWPVPRTGGKAPPFIADESSGGDARAGVKELTAEAVVAPDPLPDDGPDEPQHRSVLGVTAPARIDAATARDLSVDVTVENTSSRPVRLMLRPEILAFDVASTKGVYRCAWRGYGGSPIAEVFTSVAPHAKATTNVQLASICPDGALRQAGLYVVRAHIDARKASGASIGIESFDGVADASAPTLLRIRHASSALGPSDIAWAKGSSAAAPNRPSPAPRPVRRPGGHR